MKVIFILTRNRRKYKFAVLGTKKTIYRGADGFSLCIGSMDSQAYMTGNIVSRLPADLSSEVFEELLRTPHVRIERIVSNGHSSPQSGWYDQEESEWVVVLSGTGAILFENGEEVVLKPGDSVHIPAHTRHRVAWTDRSQPTVWLAVFYR